jgi:hypothetical protein
MRIPEFIGGLLIGFSIYLTVLSTFYLSEISGETLTGAPFFELLIPFAAAAVAGLGIGFGLKSDDDTGYGLSFSDWSEHWPALIGGLGLAASVGTLMLLYFSATPTSGLVYSFISIFLCVFGTILAVLNWESGSPY